MSHHHEKQAVCNLAAEFAARGWLPATSGNLSVKLSQFPLRAAITRSGADKQHLTTNDILIVDQDQTVLEDTAFRPSAETVVHTKLYETLGCGAVVHVHTVFNNLASDVYFEEGVVRLAGYELLKALGHWEENAVIEVPIVENFHHLGQLADAVVAAAHNDVPGVLVRNHGIYAWGNTTEEAKRHLEAFEFLFEYHLRRQQFFRR